MEFFKHKDIQTIFKILNGRARTARVMIVGGAVRDYVLGLPVVDIDMATIYSPHEVTDLLAGRFKIIPTGIEHGTVTALTGCGAVQITSLRKDIETDGRRAVVSFTDDWVLDAQRRDFTMNTLLMDRQGKIFDPLGMGLADAQAKRVRFVGDKDARIQEDYLRILRYARFQARCGQGSITPTYLALFKKHRDGIKKLSVERITDEILKIIMLPQGLKISALFIEYKILSFPKITLPSLEIFKKLSSLGFLSLPLSLAMMASFKQSNMDSLKSQLRLPHKLIKEVDLTLDCFKSRKKKSLDFQLYKYGREVTRSVYIVSLIQAGHKAAYIKKALYLLDQMPVPVFPLSGKDLFKAGYSQGEAMGRELKRLEAVWIESGFTSVPSVLKPPPQ